MLIRWGAVLEVVDMDIEVDGLRERLRTYFQCAVGRAHRDIWQVQAERTDGKWFFAQKKAAGDSIRFRRHQKSHITEQQFEKN